MSSMMTYGWFFQILIFIVFFLIVWWLIKSGGFTQRQETNPLDILKQRLAKGEITKKEFDELKKEIE